MKKNYITRKQIILSFFFLLLINLSSLAQSRSVNNAYKNMLEKTQVTNSNINGSSALRQGISNTTVATACGSYTWTQNGQTYNASGTYTAPDGITQSFSDFDAWSISTLGEGASQGSNDLNGITVANPTPISVDFGFTGINGSITATGGMYAAATFIGSNQPNVTIVITFSAPVYGASADIFATNISDAVIPGTVTATYFNGATSLFTDTRLVTAATESYGYSSTTAITSIELSIAASSPVVNRYISFRNFSIAIDPTAQLILTINPAAATPTGSAAQTLLNTDTVASIVVNPTTVIWYATDTDAVAGTNPLNPSTVLTNATTYYAVDQSGACPSSPFAVNVTTTPLANEQFSNLNFSYYPNPTSDVLNIKNSKNITEVIISNLLGQVLLSKKTSNTLVQLDLSALAKATYIVKVVVDGSEKTVKITKE